MKQHINNLRKFADSLSKEDNMPIIDALDVAISVMNNQLNPTTESVGTNLVYLRESDRPKKLKFSEFIATSKQLHGMNTEVVDWDKAYQKYERLTGPIQSYHLLIDGEWRNRAVNLHRFLHIVVVEVYEDNKCLLWAYDKMEDFHPNPRPEIMKAHFNSGTL